MQETIIIEQQKVEEPEPEEENYEPEQEPEVAEVEPPLKLAGKKRFEGVDSLANNRLIVEDTVNRIISGRECIYGGEGWWKYEFCYGKSVIQYHIGEDGERSEILLGVFDEKVHKAWIDEDPKQRSPKKKRRSTSTL
ncbi:glucosidase II beta subunit-like protein [Oesophagostomum dentatum]|uniref:Endoplasmic reticulum lectin 1 n=1 Tax=Oesophagostomum dentatum TaxID=61180 RepID=A0A0B1S410_OESDE|nr:glucosidase II beta subunit-like protein [Oesophagostomum dentatum]